MAEDELFWRLIAAFDPDVIGHHLPTLGDVEEIAPAAHEAAVEDIHRQLSNLGFNDAARAAEVDRLREHVWWNFRLSDAFQKRLIERLALLHVANVGPRDVLFNGTSGSPYPFTDVGQLRDLPESVVDITTSLADVDRLLLTHTVGRILPSFRTVLADRGVRLNAVAVEHEPILLQHLWPYRGVVADFTYPRVLAQLGLARRVSLADRGQVIVVVGEEKRDFLLFHGLQRLRPYVFWLPTSRLGNEDSSFIYSLAEAARDTAQNAIGGGNLIAVTSATDDAAAAEAATSLNALADVPRPEAVVTPWRELIPRGPLSDADARSERRVSLLRHEGETQELPTPLPVSISAADPFKLRWMVETIVDGWTPIKHPSLGPDVLRGPMITAHEARTSTTGPCYFGLSPFTQPILGLEGPASRPRLRPHAILEQVRTILSSAGWTVSLSDKGAFASRTADLFGGTEKLAHALKSPATRGLLDSYTSPRKSDGAGLFLTDTRRRYLSLEEAEVIVVDADAAGVLSDLYERNVLRRGHILKCEHCRATSFYTLTEGQEFVCVRCRTAQRATRFSWLGTAEPEFRYALSEVVFQFLQHNGHLPFLAVYDHFVVGRGRRERRSFDASFEVELTSREGELREHDIVAAWGADLWLGEATTTEKLARNQTEERRRLERLRATAVATGARGVLLVTTRAEFRAATKQAVSRTLKQVYGLDVVYCEAFNDGPADAAVEDV